MTLALLRVRPGDILHVEKGRYVGRAVVLSSAHRKGGMRLTTLTTRRDLLLLTADDFHEPPTAIGRMELPADFAPNRNDFQRRVATALEQAEVTEVPGGYQLVLDITIEIEGGTKPALVARSLSRFYA